MNGKKAKKLRKIVYGNLLIPENKPYNLLKVFSSKVLKVVTPEGKKKKIKASSRVPNKLVVYSDQYRRKYQEIKRVYKGGILNGTDTYQRGCDSKTEAK